MIESGSERNCCSVQLKLDLVPQLIRRITLAFMCIVYIEFVKSGWNTIFEFYRHHFVKEFPCKQWESFYYTVQRSTNDSIFIRGGSTFPKYNFKLNGYHEKDYDFFSARNLLDSEANKMSMPIPNFSGKNFFQ